MRRHFNTWIHSFSKGMFFFFSGLAMAPTNLENVEPTNAKTRWCRISCINSMIMPSFWIHLMDTCDAVTTSTLILGHFE